MKGKLIINPIGGLANRMRTLAGGLTMASELGLDYKVIWLKNWEIAAGYEDIFELPECLKDKIEMPSKTKYEFFFSIPRKRNLWISGLTLRRFELVLYDSKVPLTSILSREDSDEELNRIVRQATIGGKSCYIQGGTNIYGFSPDFYRDLFILRGKLQMKVNEVLAVLGDSPIGVHIRRTDNIMSIEHSPLSLFESEIEKIVQKNPSQMFYLATDSDEVKRVLKDRFGTNLVTSENSARRDTREGIEDAAVEMFVLSKTSKIIGSYYSSFSEAAALLGGCQLEVMRK